MEALKERRDRLVGMRESELKVSAGAPDGAPLPSQQHSYLL